MVKVQQAARIGIAGKVKAQGEPMRGHFLFDRMVRGDIGGAGTCADFGKAFFLDVIETGIVCIDRACFAAQQRGNVFACA